MDVTAAAELRIVTRVSPSGSNTTSLACTDALFVAIGARPVTVALACSAGSRAVPFTLAVDAATAPAVVAGRRRGGVDTVLGAHAVVGGALVGDVERREPVDLVTPQVDPDRPVRRRL